MEDGLSRRVFLEILVIGAITVKDKNSPTTLNIPELPKKDEYIFSYEEWRTARKNPASKEAALVKNKARKIKKNPDLALRLFSSKEKESYDSSIDITRKQLTHLKNLRTKEGFEGAWGTVLYSKYIKYRVDLFNLYPGIIDFDNPGKGAEIIVTLHTKYERRYIKESKKK